MRRFVVVAAFTLGGLLVPVEARAADTAVSIKTSAYNPRDVVVVKGDTVVWTNEDSAGHSVTADDGSFDSHPECGDGGVCMSKDEVFKWKFDMAGEFPYYCSLHGSAGGTGMAGKVTVLG